MFKVVTVLVSNYVPCFSLSKLLVIFNESIAISHVPRFHVASFLMICLTLFSVSAISMFLVLFHNSSFL